MAEDTPKDKPSEGNVPDPEVRVDQPKKRRNLTAKYKLQILREADACKDAGELGALLRREGLYSSLLSNWRRERKEGKLSASRETKRGPKPVFSEVEQELFQLRGEYEELKLKYDQAQKLIEAQKKIAEIFESATRERRKPEPGQDKP